MLGTNLVRVRIRVGVGVGVGVRVGVSLLWTNSAWSAAPAKSVMNQVSVPLLSTTDLGSNGSSKVKARESLPDVDTPG